MSDKLWGRVFNRKLNKGADHGHAAHMADEAVKRKQAARRRLNHIVEAVIDDIINATDEEILTEAAEAGWSQEDIDYLRKKITEARQ